MSNAARYLPHGPFQAALKERVDAYFTRTAQHPQRSPGMLLKTMVFFGWLIGSYLVAMFVATSWWQVGLAAISMGLALAGIGFNVQHDGSHGAYGAGRLSNGLAAASLDFIGASSYIWSWKHNVFHHSHPNRVELDADIDIQPFCRLAPEQAKYPAHRFQHIYIWFLYSLLAFKWLFDDFRDIAKGTIGGQHFPRPRGWKLAQFLTGKAFFFAWSMVLPVMLHPVVNVVATWLVASVAISIVMAMVFQMAHVVELASFAPRSSEPTSRWAEHQVASTADFGQDNRLLTWFTGGLNFQIEHHLFPRICHMHLPALAPIVKATCEEFGVPYRAYPSAASALKSHVRWLRTMGRDDGALEVARATTA